MYCSGSSGGAGASTSPPRSMRSSHQGRRAHVLVGAEDQSGAGDQSAIAERFLDGHSPPRFTAG